MDGFIIHQKLGDGSYSTVYECTRKSDNLPYAMKQVKILGLSDREKEAAINEVRILASIESPFIAGYKEAFFDSPSSCLCLIMELADDGDVYQKVVKSQENKVYLKEKFVWRVLIQAMKGLMVLHKLKILHRDMKSANIFLFKNGAAKLGDLNVSKVAKEGLLHTQTGTPYYAPPEIWRNQPYDLKSDIWSFGCVIYEMCALVPPFKGEDMTELFKKVLRGQYPAIPTHFSMDMRQLIKAMLHLQPQQRPTCEELLAMPIVQKRMRKYFAGKDGKLEEFMQEQQRPQDQLFETIKIQSNIFKTQLPQDHYNSVAVTRNLETSKRQNTDSQYKLQTSIVTNVTTNVIESEETQVIKETHTVKTKVANKRIKLNAGVDQGNNDFTEAIDNSPVSPTKQIKSAGKATKGADSSLKGDDSPQRQSSKLRSGNKQVEHSASKQQEQKDTPSIQADSLKPVSPNRIKRIASIRVSAEKRQSKLESEQQKDRKLSDLEKEKSSEQNQANYRRVVSVYQQEQDLKDAVIRPPQSKTVSIQQKHKSYQDPSAALPYIYSAVRAPIIGPSQKFMSVIDHQNNCMLNQLLQRNSSYESIDKPRRIQSIPQQYVTPGKTNYERETSVRTLLVKNFSKDVISGGPIGPVVESEHKAKQTSHSVLIPLKMASTKSQRVVDRITEAIEKSSTRFI